MCGRFSRHGVQASNTVEDLHLHRIQARAGSPAQQSDSEHSDFEAQQYVVNPSCCMHALLCLSLERTIICRQAQPAAAPQEEAELQHQTAADQVQCTTWLHSGLQLAHVLKRIVCRMT